MDVALYTAEASGLESPLTAVFVFTGERGPDFVAFDQASGGRLAAIADEEGFVGEPGKTLLVHTSDAKARRVLLVGAGKAADATAADLRKLGAVAVEEAQRRKLPAVAIVVPAALASDPALAARCAAEGAHLGAYRYTAWLTVDVEAWTVGTATLVMPGADAAALAPVLARAKAACDAVALARDLVNAPPVEVTPRRMAEVAEQIARDEGLECTILDVDAIRAQGMNLFLAVNAGSTEPARFIHLTYRPPGSDASTPSIALVGKGLTYDSGGYNIKPTGSLEDMKIDMAGGAAVLGAMKAVRAFAPGVVVHGIVPSTENLVSATAYKPGDIIRAKNGKTVEIMNTDAEGRLILADALTYAADLGVHRIVDLATLTGACMVALGPHTAGLFANDDGWRDRILAAAARAGEDFWALPLTKKLRPMLKSPVADMKNIGERWGGAITGALFLQEFIGKATWAHMDIAGPASADKPEPGTPRGGTGFGVLTLLELVSAGL
ncbi:MAG: leucyl aminopeptidase [Deltaproteobacteria bacterium]|nr:leucyl aminopeptidase [Deltaproteobacteria bacterium]